MRKPAYMVIALALLSACQTQSTVQREYIAMRDTCQGQAEARFATLSANGTSRSIKDRNAELVSLFSDCMFESGWTVGTPKRRDEKQTASIIPDPQNPQNQTSARPPATAATVPAPTPHAGARYTPVENQQLMRGAAVPATSTAAPTTGAAQFYNYPQNFKADPGVGVGASVKPGREFAQ